MFNGVVLYDNSAKNGSDDFFSRAFFQQHRLIEENEKVISSAPVLALYDPKKSTLVSADSSSYGLGAVLKQRQLDNTWRPVVFASRALTDIEKRYAQVEKECLALTWACERFSDYLIGSQFTLQTDHKPLTSLLSPQCALDDVPPRIQRMRTRLVRFDFVTEYIPGSQLGTADVLSRFPLTNQPQLNDTSDIIEGYVSTIITSLPLTDVMIKKLILATAANTTLQHAITYCTTSWPDVNDLTLDLKSYWHSRDLLTIQDNLILYNSRIAVPSFLRQETLTALHAGHLSIEKCRESKTVCLVAKDWH